MDAEPRHRRGELNHLLRTSLSAAVLSGAVVLASATAAGVSTSNPPTANTPTASTLTASRAPSTASAVFSFSDPRITESSGLAASSFDASIYTHNDSGDSARFFRIDSHGDTTAVYTLRGATNIDWEDMATSTDATGNRLLYFADIGDNTDSRKEVQVYEVKEPHGPSGDVPWVRYRFAYPDGAHDAEALLVDPRTHRLYIATKSLMSKGELYAAPATLRGTSVNVLTPVRSVPALTTSADFSPDGRYLVLLTYIGAYWADGVGGTWRLFDVPLQQQNEALAFTIDGSAVLVGSEGAHSVVYRVQVPWSGKPGGTPTTSGPALLTPSATSAAEADPASSAFGIVLAAVAGILLALLVFGAYAMRRRRS